MYLMGPLVVKTRFKATIFSIQNNNIIFPSSNLQSYLIKSYLIISHLKSQIANRKSQIANRKSQIANRKSQIANLKSHSTMSRQQSHDNLCNSTKTRELLTNTKQQQKASYNQICNYPQCVEKTDPSHPENKAS